MRGKRGRGTLKKRLCFCCFVLITHSSAKIYAKTKRLCLNADSGQTLLDKGIVTYFSNFTDYKISMIYSDSWENPMMV